MKNWLVNNATRRRCTLQQHFQSSNQTCESLPGHTHVQTEKPYFLRWSTFPLYRRTPHSVPTSSMCCHCISLRWTRSSIPSIGPIHVGPQIRIFLEPLPQLWIRVRGYSQWVVDHGYVSEKRGGRVGGRRLRHSDGGGVWATDNVMEEEVKVAQLFLL